MVNLTIEQTSEPQDDKCISVHNARGEIASDVGTTAALHGRDLFREGFTIEQVVRDYGDVCQAVTKLAIETGVPISVDEFRTFNRCLDNAIAGAVDCIGNADLTAIVPIGILWAVIFSIAITLRHRNSA
jgi:hypothetical protein